MDHSFQKKSEHCWLASQEGRSTKTAAHICTRKTEVWWIHFGFIMVEGKPQAWQPKIPLFRAQTTKVMLIASFHGFRGDDPWCLFLKVLVYTHKENSNLDTRFGCLVATSSPMSAKSHNTHEMEVRMRYRRLWRPQGVHYAYNIDMIWNIAYPMIGDDGSWCHGSQCFSCFHPFLNIRHHWQKT